MHASAGAASRFFNRDELRYSLRSLDRFAPYVRRVFLVTADQRPAWLADHPDLSLVSHRDLFPDPSHLPTYNSHAIEAHLHRIEGLSEHFIYLNDDVLFSSPSRSEDFFDDCGRSVLYEDERDIAWSPSDKRFDQPAQSAARNCSRWLEARYGFQVRNRIEHVPYALHRSVLEEVWKWIPDPMEATSSHRTRHPDDISIASCFAPWFAACTGRAVRESDRHAIYIKLKKKRSTRLAAHLEMFRCRHFRGHLRRFLSVNDCGDLDGSPRTAAAVSALFEALYPSPSRFERALQAPASAGLVATRRRRHGHR